MLNDCFLHILPITPPSPLHNFVQEFKKALVGKTITRYLHNKADLS